LQRYDLSEACRYLRISKPTLYNLIRDGKLRSIKQGGRRFVNGGELARLSA
jgi:excisionase family DNA binding protein